MKSDLQIPLPPCINRGPSHLTRTSAGWEVFQWTVQGIWPLGIASPAPGCIQASASPQDLRRTRREACDQKTRFYFQAKAHNFRVVATAANVGATTLAWWWTQRTIQ